VLIQSVLIFTCIYLQWIVAQAKGVLFSIQYREQLDKHICLLAAEGSS